MKFCPNCDASNINSEEFCTECQWNLAEVVQQAPAEASPAQQKRIKFSAKDSSGERDPAIDRLTALLASVETVETKGEVGRRHPSIMFLLDFTDDAGARTDIIRESVRSFTDWMRRAGLIVRVGSVEFRGRAADDNGESLASSMRYRRDR